MYLNASLAARLHACNRCLDAAFVVATKLHFTVNSSHALSEQHAGVLQPATDSVTIVTVLTELQRTNTSCRKHRPKKVEIVTEAVHFTLLVP